MPDTVGVMTGDSEPEIVQSPPPGLRQQAVSGATWTIAGYGTLQVLRFGANLLLTTLIAPELFGLMGLVTLFIQGLHMFSDIGLRQGVVRSPHGEEPAFLGTAWTLQVGRGALLWLGSLALAYPAAWFYAEPDLLWLLPMVGLTALFDGFNSATLFVLTRRLRQDWLMLLEISAYVVGVSCTLFFLWRLKHFHADDPHLRGWQLLALAGGSLLTATVTLALSFALPPRGRTGFAWDRPAARELFHFGGWITVATACTFLGQQADRLFLGTISMALFGVYHLSVQLQRVPTTLMHALCNQTIFPMASRLREHDPDAERSFAGLHWLLTCAAGWLATGLAAAGPTLMWAYDPRYALAGDYLPWFGLVAWLTMLQHPREALLLADGRSRALAFGQGLKTLAVVPCLWLGYRWGGVVGLIAGGAAAEFLRYLQLVIAAGRPGLRLATVEVALTAIAVALWWLFARVGGPPPVAFALQALGLTVAWAIVTALGRYLAGRVNLKE